MIQLICSYFNYHNNEIRKKNYINFRKSLNHNIITTEVCLDKNCFFIDDSIKILANEKNILWQKERCFNIILESLSDKIDKVVWIDTDIIFHEPNWLKKTEKILDEIPYVQPFDRVFEKHYHSNPQLNCIGYGRLLYDYIHFDTKIVEPVASGLCWGVHRQLLNNGFFDKHILGSNDSLQTIAVLGDIFNQILIRQSKEFILSFLDYYESNSNMIDGSKVGYIPGTLEHLYHGKTKNRGYTYREQLLRNYNPKDLEIDINGLYKLNDEELYIKIKEYMNDRNENTTK